MAVLNVFEFFDNLIGCLKVYRGAAVTLKVVSSIQSGISDFVATDIDIIVHS